MAEWVFICGSDNVFQQLFLCSKNIRTKRFDVLVGQLFRVENCISTVEHFLVSVGAGDKSSFHLQDFTKAF